MCIRDRYQRRVHGKADKQLQGFISNSSDPSSPLYHLRQSGKGSPGIQKAYKHFVVSLFESMFFIKNMKTVSEELARHFSLDLSRPSELTSEKTLVLDLDETLVHCVEDDEPAEVRVPITLPFGITATAGVNLRPGILHLLKTLSPIYEIVVFTASMQEYADAILDYIDKDRKLIHHRLYRNNCLQYSSSIFIKDLRVLKRDLKNVIIVDNAPYAFASQLDNGYPILPFYDCKEDDELKQLTNFLQKIQGVKDVREPLRTRFKLCELRRLGVGDYMKYYQPGGFYGSDPGESTPPLSEMLQKNSKTIQK
eukprot:TRINITY_DN11038_c0_g1_i2.p1 TRINITY_DN11038_c0_g1~~TRINITY_DN11038_c0_g1_i2.p1  ORF type:complete len:309 (-),score=36.42 TRINITY_DN11038_c0_g1_i2:78-1004(-)